MPTMAIMIGIQASGKSTFCKSYLDSYTRINLDLLHTRNKESIALVNAISANEDIVIDNTNISVSDRAKYMVKAKAYGYKVIGYFMQSRLQECIKRNDNRHGKERIPVNAIAFTSNKLELPSYGEGFDELYFVSIVNDKYQIEEWRTEE